MTTVPVACDAEPDFLKLGECVADRAFGDVSAAREAFRAHGTLAALCVGEAGDRESDSESMGTYPTALAELQEIPDGVQVHIADPGVVTAHGNSA